MTYQLIMRNTSEKNWEFNDMFDNFEELIERISKTLSYHKDEIKKTGFYDIKKPFEIKIYNIRKVGS